MPEVVVDDSWAGGRKILEVCGDFAGGKCDRGPDRCKFAHPDDKTRQVAKEANVCLDSLMRTRKCTYKNCRYYHPPAHIEFKDISNGRLDLCLKFMDSSCDEPECPLAHPEKESQIVHYVAVCDDEDCASAPREDCVYHHRTSVYPVDVCYDYTQGKCQRGNTCRFSHSGPVSSNASRSGRPNNAGGTGGRRADSPRRRRCSRTPPRAPSMQDRRFDRNADPRPRSRSAYRDRGMRGERDRSPPRDKPSDRWGKGDDAMDSAGPKGKGKGEMMRAMWEMMSWMWGSGGDWGGKGSDGWSGKGKGSDERGAPGDYDSSNWKGGKGGDWSSGGDRKDARGSSRGRGDDRAPRRDDRARGSDKPYGDKREGCRDFDRGMCDRGSRCVFAHAR